MELVEELVVAGAGLDAAWRPGKCVVVVFGKLDGVAVEVVGGSLGFPLDGSWHSLPGLWWKRSLPVKSCAHCATSIIPDGRLQDSMEESLLLGLVVDMLLVLWCVYHNVFVLCVCV